jgi:hypothetical protein
MSIKNKHEATTWRRFALFKQKQNKYGIEILEVDAKAEK